MRVSQETTKPSGFDWIGNIPSSWTVDRIKDVIPAIYGGGTPDSSHPEYWEDGNVTWITPSDFQDFEDSNVISDSRRRITPEGLEASAATLLPAGSVVMASRATIGIAKIAGVQLCTNQGFVSFVCGRISNKFFRYAIEGYLGDMFASVASGTTFREISRSEVRRAHFAFPSFEEQRRIVAYLDKACGLIDGAIHAKQQQLEVLDNLRKSIIHKALTRGLDEKTRLKNVATINGRSLGNETSPAYTFRYLEISNVNNRGIISEDAISETAFEGAPSRARRVVQDGDTVISSVRPNLQAVAFIQDGGGDLIASTGFYVVSPLRHKLDEKFAYYILLLDGSRQHFEAVAKGVGYPAIDDKDFGTLKFHLPPLAEQRRIAAYLDKECKGLDDLHRTLEKQISALEKYRKSLIHECVTGKRRINKEGITVSSL